MTRGNLRRSDHLFFSGMAVIMLGTVFLGFARTYYLAGGFRAPLPSIIVHIHGAVFSSWIVLLIAQCSLVAGGRVDLHRRLGFLAFGLACVMIILGSMTAIDSLVRHFGPGEKGREANELFAGDLSRMLGFGTLIYFGFRERFYPAAHKRLMLISTVMLMDVAFVRWPIPAAWWKLQAAQLCSYMLLLLIGGYDLWSSGRLHRATAWGSAWLILLSQAAGPVGRTGFWQIFGTTVRNLVHRN
jgi:hypothetical protein